MLAVRILAARAARAAPDGLHQRRYRTDDPELDSLLWGVVEGARHGLPGQVTAIRVALRTLGRRSFDAPRRIAEIIRDAGTR